jgi:hypothetical protein
MQVTYKLAMAAGWDAANRRMQKAGRTSWNRADYGHAADTVRKLLGGWVCYQSTSATEPK